MMCPKTRFDVCPACDGAGQFEHLTGYDPHDGGPTGWIEWCDHCRGTGIAAIPVEPIEQEDLGEKPGMADHSNEWYAGYGAALNEIRSWKENTKSLSRLNYHVHKLSIGPDDIIVFSTPEALTEEQMAQVRTRLIECLRPLGMEDRALIFSRGADLSTITP